MGNIRDDVEYLYESLKGRHIRSKYGELTIPGFEDEDYEELYYQVLDMLSPIIGENYWEWYERQMLAKHRHFLSNRASYQSIDYAYDTPMENHSLRMQLSVLKFAVGRRYWSDYDTKGEMLE